MTQVEVLKLGGCCDEVADVFECRLLKLAFELGLFFPFLVQAADIEAVEAAEVENFQMLTNCDELGYLSEVLNAYFAV